MQSWYVLDKADQIIAIDGDWDRFALKNGGPKAISERILGHTLWSYISGFETRSLLNAIFFTCRRQQSIYRSHYRCDSPTVTRLIEFKVQPLPNGGLSVGHVQISKAQKPHNNGGTEIPHQARRCSICCWEVREGSWQMPCASTPEDFSKVIHDVCPRCKSDCLHRVRSLKPHLNATPSARSLVF